MIKKMIKKILAPIVRELVREEMNQVSKATMDACFSFLGKVEAQKITTDAEH